MLTENKLPLMVKSIDYNTGTAEVIERTEIKRDGVVIHTINDHQTILIEEIKEALMPLSSAIDNALINKKEAKSLAPEAQQ